MFVAKLHSTGEVAWLKKFGSSRLEKVHSIVVNSKNEIVISGFIYGTFDDVKRGEYDNVFVMKLSNSGETLWTRQYGIDGLTKMRIRSMAIDANDSVYTMATDNTQWNVIHLNKFGDDGAIVWREKYALPDTGWPEDIKIDSQYQIYITGNTKGKIAPNIAKGSSSTTDFFLLKLDAEGNQLYERQYGSVESDYAYALALDENGDVCIAGGVGGTLDGNIHYGNDDIFLMKTPK